MKKILFALALIAALVSCEKAPIEEAPGLIPGMGNAGGELEVTPLDLDEDFEIIGSITGTQEASISAVNSDLSLKSTEIYNNSGFGCGGQYIKLKVTVRNKSNKKKTLYLRKGLVAQVDDKDSQNAILIQSTWVCFEAGETRTFDLNMFCLNYGLGNATVITTFIFKGYTTSPIMRQLILMMMTKRCNYEHYLRLDAISTKSTDADELTYNEVQAALQKAVWAITNGDGLTEEQIAFIESLPDLEEGSYPKGLNDDSVALPEYFEEYASDE